MSGGQKAPLSFYHVKQTLSLPGAISTVLLVQLKNDLQKMRVIRQTDLTKLLAPIFGQTEITKEVEKLNRHGHPNVVRIYNAFVLAGEKIVQCKMEYCQDEDQIANWFAQIALAVNYFTDQDLSHCDLTAKNIYFKFPPSDGISLMTELKVGDYCNSHLKSVHRQQQTTIKPGNVGYLAPEVLKGKSSGDEKADVWTLGILLFQLATLRLPVADSSTDTLINKAKRNERDVQVSEEKYSEELRILVDKLLQYKPKNRPSVAHVLKDPFIRGQVVLITGGRGWSALQREEDHAAEIAKQKELAEQLKLSQAATLKSDFCSKFSGQVITCSDWFTAPSSIAELLLLHSPQNFALVICTNGDVFAVANNPTTNRSKLRWQGAFNVPPFFSLKTCIEHAAVDPFQDPIVDIFFTVIENRSGIFRVNAKQLQDEFVTNPTKPTAILAKQYIHDENDGRRFFGMAVSIKADLLFCCDRFDVGVWSLKSRNFLLSIKHPQFHPLKCSCYFIGELSKIQLATTDKENGKVFIFSFNIGNDGNMIKQEESVEILATTGTSRGISFDYSGQRLLVAEEGNQRIQIFSSISKITDDKWQLATTLSTTSRSLVKIQVPSVGVLLEQDTATVKTPADFRLFILQAFTWQCQIAAHFQPPGV